jgi:dTDP-4-dehydrorhamnose 3,5-epimerase-like enzyme
MTMPIVLTGVEMDGSLLIKTLSVVRDSRGQVFEPLAGDMAHAARWPNFHVATMEPGAVRGNHRHPQGTELIVLFGSDGSLVYEEGAARRKLSFDRGSALAVLIPPGVAHAIQNTGEGVLVLLCFQSRAYDPHDPDREPCSLIPAPSNPE